MRKPDFDHLIAAAATVSEEDEIVVVGSQAILGSVPDPPASLLRSIEADVYPRRNPERAEEIDGALGDGSPFQQTYGYYAHGVGPETAKAPAGWEDRLVRVPVRRRPGESGVVHALCLEVHDLVLSKCVAGRQHDLDFAEDALAAGLVELAELFARVPGLPISDEERDRVNAQLTGVCSRLGLAVAAHEQSASRPGRSGGASKPQE